MELKYLHLRFCFLFINYVTIYDTYFYLLKFGKKKNSYKTETS